MTIYEEHGYKDRTAYLYALGVEYGHDIVEAISDVYGPEEDFDGLLMALQDSEVWL